MRKGTITMLLAGVLLLASFCPRQVSAAAKLGLDLRFSNNIATCTGTVRGNGRIVVSMELWQGGTTVASWNASGNLALTITKTCAVEPGLTYTLKLNGTIGGVAFQELRVIKTNYEMRSGT